MAQMCIRIVAVNITVYLLVLFKGTHTYIYCPNFYIEKGDTKIISCTSDEVVVDSYWYRGQTSQQSPILKLDSSGIGGTEYGGEHFQINSNGSMIITNAKIEHESYYTFVGYFMNGNFSTSTFLVNVTITPNPPCLVINGCEPCESCNLSVSRKSGALVCSVSGSRPSIPLNWTISSHHGISFIKHQQNEEWVKTTDTWSTSVLLEYEITESCGVKVVFHCEAEDSLHILESSVASVEISNDVCRDDGIAPSIGWMPVVICIGAVLLLLTLVAAVSLVVIRRHRPTSHGGWNDGHTVELRPLLDSKDKNVSELLSKLRRCYAKYCFLRPLPWGEDIPIARLYTECNYTVTDRKGKTTTISDITFLVAKYIGVERRIVFVGGLGYGKTTMTKWIIQHWIKQENPNFVLIYILLKDVEKDMKLSDIVLESLPQDSKLTTDTIEKVLRSSTCIVLLDGLDELSMSSENDKAENPKYKSHKKQSSSQTDSRLTIRGLLDGQVQLEYDKLHVWVTSRQIDYVKQQFPLPYITVKLNGFSPDQADEYIKITCKYYFLWRSLGGTGRVNDQVENNETCIKSNDGNEGTVSGCNSSGARGVVKQAKIDPEKQLVLWVKDFVDENDIFYDFKDTPLLFILMVHVLADAYTTKAPRSSDLPKMPTLTALVSMIIKCLESRYMQKRKCEKLPTEVSELESKLGQTAFDNNVQLGVREREFWDAEVGEENVDIALEVGLLKLSQKPTSNSMGGKALVFSSFTGIEFYHDFFQEYLAARHILQNLHLFDKLKTLVEKRNDGSTIRILQFMSGTEDSPLSRVCRLLLDMKKWNNFIDCAYEARDRKEITGILENAKSKHFDVTYLDKKYHTCAVKTFCEQCHHLQIKLEKLTFQSDCEIEFLTTISLPQCDSLEFYKGSFKEQRFVMMLQWFATKSVISQVRFVDCVVPERISEPFMIGIRDIHGKDFKVYRTRSRKLLPDVTQKLDLQTGKWK